MMNHEEFEKVLRKIGYRPDVIDVYETVLYNLCCFYMNKSREEDSIDDPEEYYWRKSQTIFEYLEERSKQTDPGKERIIAKWYKVQVWGPKGEEDVCCTFGEYPEITEWAFNKMRQINGKAIFIKEITREEVLS